MKPNFLGLYLLFLRKNDESRFEGFNFNFEADTGIVRQSGNFRGDYGLYIGDFGADEFGLVSSSACGSSVRLLPEIWCRTKLDVGGEVIPTEVPESVPEPASIGLTQIAILRRRSG